MSFRLDKTFPYLQGIFQILPDVLGLLLLLLLLLLLAFSNCFALQTIREHFGGRYVILCKIAMTNVSIVMWGRHKLKIFYHFQPFICAVNIISLCAFKILYNIQPFIKQSTSSTSIQSTYFIFARISFCSTAPS